MVARGVPDGGVREGRWIGLQGQSVWPYAVLAEEVEKNAVIVAACGWKPPGRKEKKRGLCRDICAERNGSGKIRLLRVDVMELGRTALRIMMQKDWVG